MNNKKKEVSLAVRLARIEGKVDALMEMARGLDPRQSMIDEVIDRLHHAARAMRRQEQRSRNSRRCGAGDDLR